MSFGLPSKTTRAAILRIVVLVAIAVGTAALQVVLVCVYRNNVQTRNQPGELNDSWNVHWRKLLRLSDFAETTFLSGVVCEDELVMLVRHRVSRASSFWDRYSHEIIRCHLRTGRIRTFPASPSVARVVSDGQKLWWLDDRYDANSSRNPFVWNGRLVEVVGSESRGLFQLSEQIEGRQSWKRTNVFVLVPRYDFFGRGLIYQQGKDFHLLAYRMHGLETYYRSGLPTGTMEQAEEFVARYPKGLTELTTSQLDEIGWKRVHNFPPNLENEFSTSPLQPFGFWFEKSQPCAIAVEFDTNEQNVSGFRWYRCQADGVIESKRIEYPIRWVQTTGMEIVQFSKRIGQLSKLTNHFRVVTSANGDVFIVSYNLDGRLHVLKWDEGRLRLISQRGSPLIYGAALDFAEFVGLTIVLPILVLGLAAWIFQRFWAAADFSFGAETVTLASGFRRGIARLIDVSIPLSLLALSIILHPDAIGWRRQLQFRLNSARRDFEFMKLFPARYSVQDVRLDAGNLFLDVTSVPFEWRLAIPAIAFCIVQIVLQARTGRTLGKYLTGVKVLRTTLRPCGLARSLLREILFVLDSVLLVSWLPGVMFILATKRSQRIGDLLADTIVVRDALTKSNVHQPRGFFQG